MKTILHKRGDLREDGYRFVNYEKTRKYGIREKWMSPAAWKNMEAYQKRYQKAYKAKRRLLKAKNTTQTKRNSL